MLKLIALGMFVVAAELAATAQMYSSWEGHSFPGVLKMIDWGYE